MVILWLMSAVGLLVVAPLVVVLATRVVRAALESDRYASDILVHGVGITAALDAVPALLETRRAVSDVTANATAYVSALQRR
jgi:beta-lactamase regulating signal transducer with metallopeptidase domain